MFIGSVGYGTDIYIITMEELPPEWSVMGVNSTLTGCGDMSSNKMKQNATEFQCMSPEGIMEVL